MRPKWKVSQQTNYNSDKESHDESNKRKQWVEKRKALQQNKDESNIDSQNEQNKRKQAVRNKGVHKVIDNGIQKIKMSDCGHKSTGIANN